MARTIHPRHAAKGVEERRSSVCARTNLVDNVPKPNLPYTKCRTRSEHDRSSNAHVREAVYHWRGCRSVGPGFGRTLRAVCVGYIDHSFGWNRCRPQTLEGPSFLKFARSMASSSSPPWRRTTPHPLQLSAGRLRRYRIASINQRLWVRRYHILYEANSGRYRMHPDKQQDGLIGRRHSAKGGYRCQPNIRGQTRSADRSRTGIFLD